MSSLDFQPVLISLERTNNKKIVINIYEECRAWMETSESELINWEQFQLAFLFCVTFTILWHCIPSPPGCCRCLSSLPLFRLQFRLSSPFICWCGLWVFIFILFELFMLSKKAECRSKKANDLSRNTINKTNDINNLASWETIMTVFNIQV